MHTIDHHRPHHLFIDNWCYFITGRCLNKTPHWKSTEKKKIFVSTFIKTTKLFNAEVFSWIITDNHYHMMIRLKNSKDLSKFINNLHSNTSRIINHYDQTPGRQIWYQYWDYCIRNIPDFWKHFNYIIQNPLKHKLVKTLEEAYHYQYSSSPVWLKRFTVDGLNESFIKFPVTDWTPCE